MSLSDYFRSQAAWRRTKAAEYPEDARNEQSARALDSLAEYVEADADSAVDGLLPFLFEGASLGGEETHRAVSRYGYGYEAVSDTQHEEFLEELSALVLADAYDFAGEQDGQDPTGVLFTFEIDAATRGVVVPIRYWERRRNSTEAESEERMSALAPGA